MPLPGDQGRRRHDRDALTVRVADIGALLAAKAAEIEAEIAAITVPMESPGSTVQFGKRAGDSTAAAAEQLSRVATHEQMLAMQADVARAREKVADGTYGVCDVCGNTVGDERLEALPWAVRCVSCASPHRAPRRR
jgi:DnaK suppressor protein